MLEITNSKIYLTDNYNMFKTMAGNRFVNLKNVNDIINNIRKNGLLPTTIIVNEKYEVIDGQHRLEALKELKLPVRFEICDGLELKDCIAYNVSSKTWAKDDYIESYAELGYEEYKKLLRLCKEYKNISTTLMCNIAYQKYPSNRGGGTNYIDEGKFKFNVPLSDVIRKIEIINKYRSLNLHVRGNKTSIEIMLANLIVSGLVDEDRMFEQLEKYGNAIETIIDKYDSLDKLQEIYNWRKRINIRFKDDYLNLIEEYKNEK